MSFKLNTSPTIFTENNPRLNKCDLIVPYLKIILGSFPVWSLSEKTRFDELSGTSARDEFFYFFGSSRNLFWSWYQNYLDSKIELLDEVSITTSLSENKIGVTDVILSCKRRGKSSLDKDLYERVYNYSFIKLPKDGEVLKILCTSKGLLNEMLLSKDFFYRFKNLGIDHNKSSLFQNCYLQKIGGNVSAIKKPIFIELKIENTTGVIQCLAIPSPGSPFRKLTEFGLDQRSSINYLDNYLKEAFTWFAS